jgi:hypothetical protein
LTKALPLEIAVEARNVHFLAQIVDQSRDLRHQVVEKLALVDQNDVGGGKVDLGQGGGVHAGHHGAAVTHEDILLVFTEAHPVLGKVDHHDAFALLMIHAH